MTLPVNELAGLNEVLVVSFGSMLRRLISSMRSPRPLRNFGCENSHSWFSEFARAARGVYTMPRVERMKQVSGCMRFDVGE